MLLAIDVGNTNTVFGVYDGPDLQASWRVATGRAYTPTAWWAAIDPQLAARGWTAAQVTACVVGSVVPPVTMALATMSARFLRVPALIVDAERNLGVRLASDQPAQLGADRLVNAAAAFRRYGGPCIVVDFGTATKLEAITADGTYLGGAIAPGLRTASEALFARAALLQPVELVVPRRVVGTNTVASMQAGIMIGYVALVEGLITRMQAELAALGAPAPIPVIATGGLAGYITPQTSQITHSDPQLTLDGLRIVYTLNPAGPHGQPGESGR